MADIFADETRPVFLDAVIVASLGRSPYAKLIRERI